MRSERAQILSISSRKTMPLFSTFLIASCTIMSLSISLSLSSPSRMSKESRTVTLRGLVRVPSALPRTSERLIMPTWLPGMPGSQVGMINLSEVLGKALGTRTKPRKVTVRDSFDILLGEESDKLIDNDMIVQEAIRNVENNGIVFLDEIDKICARSERIGADVSREGVQRDLLPLIEGTTVGTKYGPVKTYHILFIASGAFHISKPSDL